MDSPHNINYEQIAQEYKERKSSPEFEQLSSKEIISRIIKEKAGQPQQQLSSAALRTGQTDKSAGNLAAYAASADVNSKTKVERLIKLTLEKGLASGVNFAQKEDPYILDLYHDSLADKMLEEMKSRKLI
ncbi:MAG: hypothetical protein UV58_C0011G0007 [Candidatus Wolfebacteria bacterium GW2011_GWC1_43_10]|uniref:Uncharacterized protein n=2 Tax=Candidatus Wolfeibacteriota TaxID=1752735 RepID=A0A0G1F5U1_9BACT|nr:MAG: hypothetical protein UV58_C0011G0007 [Candidatus Wolfebacteria bacterium GW2011_GWC1_43_10]KKT22568.1 MAG: hypothetical protein UW08_C0006G0008 [Parcubacteria group bacterium GW2011_GWB1_43_8b]OGM89870.1 MAG: hypothetical protein A2108_01060 [Candidatus Wolfebacteria bacterium GWA1_42_9]